MTTAGHSATAVGITSAAEATETTPPPAAGAVTAVTTVAPEEPSTTGTMATTTVTIAPDRQFNVTVRVTLTSEDFTPALEDKASSTYKNLRMAVVAAVHISTFFT